MDSIQRQITSAHRRLISSNFLHCFTTVLVSCLSIAAIAIFVPRLWFTGIEFDTWFYSWIGGATAVAFLMSLVWTWRNSPSRTDASIAIDQRFGIRERFTSALLLNEEERESPVGQALCRDAEARSEKLDVRDKFDWGFSPRMLLPFIPALIAAAAFLLPAPVPAEIAENSQAQKIKVQQVKNSTKKLLAQIERKRRELEKEDGLEDTLEEFKKIESDLKKLQSKDNIDAKKALTDLNKINKRIEQQMSKMGTGAELKKSLEGIKGLDAGEGEKMLKAMKEGKFEAASEEVQKMLDDMRAGKMSDEQKQILKEQAEALQKALEQAAADREEAKRQLQEKIEQAKMNGDSQKAAELQKKMDQMQASAQQAEQLNEMMDQLSQLQESLENGDQQAAQEALEELANQMKQMQGEMDQLSELSEMMDQLNQSKSQMICPECNGVGCPSCQKNGNQQNAGKSGEGQGEGDRPEDETDVDFFDSQVRDKMRAGETIFAGKLQGANRKGITREQVKQEILTSESDDADSIENVLLPKEQRDQTSQYFDKMRKN